MIKETDFDIIIVGGGMVGAALACALAEQPLRIAVIDRQFPKTEWPYAGFDMRVSAITWASQQILDYIGVWQNMQKRRITPFTDMKVWDDASKGEIDFHSDEIGMPYLGHIVENQVTLGALYERLQNVSNVTLVDNIQLADIEIDDYRVTLKTGDGTITSQLIVGADGARSWLREKMQIPIVARDYQQKGIVTTVTTSHGHQNTARQRFLSTGPLAFLPLSENYSSIVWSAYEDRAAELLALDDEAFKQELQQAIGETSMGKIDTVDKRAAFPLKRQHTEIYCLPRMVLVGDAAHTIHPLAGQGVNLGFLDIATLAEEIITAIEKRKHLGDFQILRRYERRRKGDNLLMMMSMDGFHWLFANENPTLSFARNAGLKFANAIGPLKNSLIEHAMGADKKLPLVHLDMKVSRFA